MSDVLLRVPQGFLLSPWFSQLVHEFLCLATGIGIRGTCLGGTISQRQSVKNLEGLQGMRKTSNAHILLSQKHTFQIHFIPFAITWKITTAERTSPNLMRTAGFQMYFKFSA